MNQHNSKKSLIGSKMARLLKFSPQLLRVKLLVNLPELRARHVRVDLGCGNTFMPQHFLYIA